jgi:hypothetical protein
MFPGASPHSGVDRLEVVDVAVGLVEVAVAVLVVAIPDVELREIGVDLRLHLAGRDLSVVPAFTESRTNSHVRAQTMSPQ